MGFYWCTPIIRVVWWSQTCSYSSFCNSSVNIDTLSFQVGIKSAPEFWREFCLLIVDGISPDVPNCLTPCYSIICVFVCAFICLECCGQKDPCANTEVHSYFCKLSPWRRQLYTLINSEMLRGALQCCILRHEGCHCCAAVLCLAELLDLQKEFLTQGLDVVWKAETAHRFWELHALTDWNILSVWLELFSRPVWVAFLVFLSASSTFFPFRSLGSCYLHNVAGIWINYVSRFVCERLLASIPIKIWTFLLPSNNSAFFFMLVIPILYLQFNLFPSGISCSISLLKVNEKVS